MARCHLDTVFKYSIDYVYLSACFNERFGPKTSRSGLPGYKSRLHYQLGHEVYHFNENVSEMSTFETYSKPKHCRICNSRYLKDAIKKIGIRNKQDAPNIVINYLCQSSGRHPFAAWVPMQDGKSPAKYVIWWDSPSGNFSLTPSNARWSECSDVCVA